MSEVMNVGGEEGKESQNTLVLICSSCCLSWSLIPSELLAKRYFRKPVCHSSLQNNLSCNEQRYSGQRCLKWPGLGWVWLDCFSVNKSSSVHR